MKSVDSLACCVFAAMAACVPLSHFTSARPLPAGTTELTATVHATAPALSLDGSSGTVGAIPQITLRRGFTDRLEAGVRIAPLYGGVEAKYGLVRAEGIGVGFNLSLAATNVVTTDRFEWDIDAPLTSQSTALSSALLLAGWKSEGWELVVSPRATLAVTRYADGDFSPWVLLAGAGVSWLFRPTPSLGIGPEVSWQTSVEGLPGFRRANLSVLQAGVGSSWAFE